MPSLRPARLPATLALACLLCPAPPGQAQTSQATPPDVHRWGINDVHQATGLPPVDGQLPEGDLLVRARQVGFGWVRYQVFWHIVNPTPADEKGEFAYDWLWVDVEIARLRAAGFNILMHVAYPPTWTTGASYPNSQAGAYCIVDSADGTGSVRNDPQCREAEYRPGYRQDYRDHGYPAGYDRSEDFRTFVRALLARYGTAVQAWSFGMEVHNQVYWRGTPEQIVDELLRPGYEEVKSHSPGALVVGPDEDVEDSFDNLLKLEAAGIAAGKSPLFDVLAFHAFAHSGWATPDQLDREWRGGEAGIDCQFEQPGERLCSLEQIVSRYRRGRPLWLTEVGYRVTDPFEPGAASRASQWLTDWIRGIKARPWIDKTFLFTLRHDYVAPPGDFGLFMNDEGNTAVPALAAVAGELATQPTPHFSYLAEGSTAGLFDLDVLVANPTSQPAPVKLTFLSDGGKVETLSDTLPATSRRTYGIGRTHMPTLSSAGGVSTVVESTLGVPLVVERTMFWNKAQKYAGHGGTAVAQPEKRWYFAEGSQGFFDTFVLLANAGNTPANVTVTFLLDDPGAAPVEVPVVLAPMKRETLWALAYPELADKSFSIVVEADVPIMAERAMYFGDRFVWQGGHESAGVPALSTRWFHAEGATGPTFDEYILVGNPSDAPTQLTVTFLLRDGGPPIVGTTELASKTRFTLNVEYAGAYLTGISGADAQRLLSAEVSVQVESTEPVVSERAMYWPGNFSTWTEAHNSFGVTETGLRWGLAEGRSGGALGYATYILIANPSNQDATVRVTFLKPDGTTGTPVEKPVAANSRENVFPHEMPAGEFGALVESTNGVPIVVERAMYWLVGGRALGGGTNATAVRLR